MPETNFQNIKKEVKNFFKNGNPKLEKARLYDNVSDKEFHLEEIMKKKNGDLNGRCLHTKRIRLNDNYYIIIRMDFENKNIDVDPILDIDLYDKNTDEKIKKTKNRVYWHNNPKEKGIYLFKDKPLKCLEFIFYRI